ncbi:hypothetical protein M409DRAFT_26247 [Zasmidium cellare ATCC 36951]|uniref:3-hydroxyacyl-CoA dehydrogenase NAD binding domain-containing protein n=1 Tax=Zasmidium cellare ATCC 36951 TaxID=1080233 RepID=A0A6A6C8P3_ZASCE|nr:uncharacterized protein M409DRAFT_26247 [Zasmidium cellare ATCC 36951]KAF2163203.1 hypothetical protein M409DRAFT_26247 [Zasmidium cellare ATCC 36951]
MASASVMKPSVSLVGAGTQGRRLAYMWSTQGHDVHLIDSVPRQLENSIAYIEGLRQADSKPLVAPGRILTHGIDGLGAVLQDSWLVVECVPERLALKRQVISEIEAAAPQDTIVASNSSSFTISEIIQGLRLQDDSRVLSAHSYWPPETNVIEIMGHSRTDARHIVTLLEQCRQHGFQPFHVKRDSVGYIYNRIWAAIKREALMVAAEGAASPQEVDDIFKSVLKTPKGPFEQMDVVGLDVVLDIEEHYAQARSGLPTVPREYLKGLISEGKLGEKNGRGFYDYSDQKGTGL